MPWKLVFYLVLLALILVFVGLNLGNTTDISFGFVQFQDVPVFMSLFVAFFVGVLVALPVAVQSSSRKTRERRERKELRRAARQRKKEARAEKASRRGRRHQVPAPEAPGDDEQ